MEPNPGDFPGFRRLRAATIFSDLRGSVILWSSGVGIFHRSDRTLLKSLKVSRPPILCAPFITSCGAMELAETGTGEERPYLPVTLLMVIHVLLLECKKLMALTACSHRSCFFCSSRECRDEAALSVCPQWSSDEGAIEGLALFVAAWRTVLVTTTWDTLFGRGYQAHAKIVVYALSMFDVSGGCNLSTDSPVRSQKRFQSTLQKFQRFTGSLWAGTLSFGGVMREDRCCDRGHFPRTRCFTVVLFGKAHIGCGLFVTTFFCLLCSGKATGVVVRNKSGLHWLQIFLVEVGIFF